MADIIQAAKWMEKGKRVTRPELGEGAFASNRFGFILFESQEQACLQIKDLLATDWEIAE